MSDNVDKWINFLDPENLKGSLIFSSLYIATFESFKDYVIDEVKFFFYEGIKDGQDMISPKYDSAVKSKDKSILKSSLLWLKDMEAIEEADVEIFDELRKYRNKLSHELMELLFEGLSDEFPEKFSKLIQLRIKIEKWWILNIEIPTDLDFDLDQEVNEDNIFTSSQIFHRLILDMLSGDEEKASYYKNELKKTFNR
jgi:hypothetical protein